MAEFTDDAKPAYARHGRPGLGRLNSDSSEATLRRQLTSQAA